jgi:hypothetical protein
VTETHVKQVPQTVCKPVHYTKTVRVARSVSKRIPYTVTRCVPRVIYEQVPVNICCPPAEGILRRLLPVLNYSG